MKIVITETFRSQYDKFRGKEKIDLEHFCKVLSQDLANNTRYLHRPYLKLKANFGNKSLRLFAVCFEDNGVVIPMYITDKNDKLLGYNMTRDVVAPFVSLWEQKMNTDLQQHKFVSFEL